MSPKGMVGVEDHAPDVWNFSKTGRAAVSAGAVAVAVAEAGLGPQRHVEVDDGGHAPHRPPEDLLHPPEPVPERVRVDVDASSRSATWTSGRVMPAAAPSERLAMASQKRTPPPTRMGEAKTRQWSTAKASGCPPRRAISPQMVAAGASPASATTPPAR